MSTPEFLPSPAGDQQAVPSPGTHRSAAAGAGTPGTQPQRVRRALDHVAHFLRSAGPQPGATIAAYLQTTLQFDPKEYGFRSLTDFLHLFGSELQIVSYAGTDRVWQLGAHGHQRVAPYSEAAEAWRALSSPNSPRRVAVWVDMQTGRWFVQRVGEPAPSGAISGDASESRAFEGGALDGGTPVSSARQTASSGVAWHPVAPMPAEQHAAVARRFAKRSDLGTIGHALAAALKVPAWWNVWRTVLEPRPELLQSWLDGRDRAVRRYVRSVLTALPLVEEPLEAAMHALRPAEHPAAPDSGAADGPVPDAEARAESAFLAGYLAHLHEPAAGGRRAGVTAPTSLGDVPTSDAPASTQHRFRTRSVPPVAPGVRVGGDHLRVANDAGTAPATDRTLLRAIVDHMTAEEIDELRVPMRAVLAVLRHH